MSGPRRAHGLRQRRHDTPGHPDAEDTIDTLRVPARPGTSETGRPSRLDLGRADRQDLEQIRSGDVLPPEEQGPGPEGPAAEEHGRIDRKELTGRRSQDDTGPDGDQTDMPGGTRTPLHRKSRHK